MLINLLGKVAGGPMQTKHFLIYPRPPLLLVTIKMFIGQHQAIFVLVCT